MKRRLTMLRCDRGANVLGLVLLIVSGVIAGFAQAASQPHPESTPTPSRGTNRRTFDQFDVSNGIRVSGGPGVAANTPVTIELVDESKYGVISQISVSALFCEEQLLLAIRQSADISPDSAFEKFLRHRLEGLIVLSESERLGLFGKDPINHPSNKKLMQESEYAVKEMIAVLGAGPKEYAQFGELLHRVTERYSVPLLKKDASGMRLDRAPLMKAIMLRISANFAQLKGQVAVGK